MARYRKIDVRMWSDAKFQGLSSAAPNAQTLWIYLLTNPETTALPGLFRAGEAGLAEALGWPREAFREAFREVSAKGLAKADWKARLVWIPNAIKYNQPENPNVVRGWRSSWDELPECSLKDEARCGLEAFMKGLSEGFRKAFEEACPKHLPKSLANQEQEQEQEQEVNLLRADARPVEQPTLPGLTLQEPAVRPTAEDTTLTAKIAGAGSGTASRGIPEADRLPPKRTAKPADPRHQATIDLWCRLWSELRGGQYQVQGGKDGTAVKRLLSFTDATDVEINRRVRAAFGDQWFREHGDLALFVSKWSTWSAPTAGASKPAPVCRPLTAAELDPEVLYADAFSPPEKLALAKKLEAHLRSHE